MKEQETREEGHIGYALGVSLVENVAVSNVGHDDSSRSVSDGTLGELIELDSHYHLVTLVWLKRGARV